MHEGAYPFLTDARPITGPVVYVLLDLDGGPCYVGSTGDLQTRLRAHRSAGKVFTRWRAESQPDRETAYQVEAVWIRMFTPRLNKAGVR